MAVSQHHSSIADDDDIEAAGPGEEDTLADAEWTVPEQYRVDSGADETAWEGTAPPPGRPRRFPPDIAPGLLLVLVAALLLLAGGILAATQLGDGEDAEPAPTPSATTTTASRPGSTTTAPPTQIAVPDVVGDPVAEARPSLEEAGFTVRTEVEPSDRPTGQVLRQSPAAETRADRGSIVLLTLSGGVERITVPDVVGMSQDEADDALREVGLRPDIRLVPSDERAGTVLSQRPAGDARVDPDTVVRLTVAEARPETVRVPRVTGLPVAEARSRLREAELRSSVTRVESPRPVGTVVRQSPSAGRELEKGETVELEVSSGPAQVTVIDVVGFDEISAREQLEGAGFRVQVVDQPTSDVSQDGLVVAQDPPSGTQADEGSVVTITVARLS